VSDQQPSPSLKNDDIILFVIFMVVTIVSVAALWW
jgi:hypothetical protein